MTDDDDEVERLVFSEVLDNMTMPDDSDVLECDACGWRWRQGEVEPTDDDEGTL